jgi:hypothetical protein
MRGLLGGPDRDQLLALRHQRVECLPCLLVSSAFGVYAHVRAGGFFDGARNLHQIILFLDCITPRDNPLGPGEPNPPRRLLSFSEVVCTTALEFSGLCSRV